MAHLGAFADAVYLEASLGQRMHILIEEYVGGQEVDLDVIVEHGVIRFCAISDNFAPPPPWCIPILTAAPGIAACAALTAVNSVVTHDHLCPSGAPGPCLTS